MKYIINQRNEGENELILNYSQSDAEVEEVLALKDAKFLTPFAFSNASEIFSNTLEPEKALAFGILLLVGSLMAAYVIYLKRDLVS